MKITFLLVENCFASGIAGLLDTFTIANLWQQQLAGRPEPIFTTELVSVDGGPVTCGSIRLLADRAIADASEVEFIIIPPLLPGPHLGGPLSIAIRDWLQASHRAAIPIAALCTGSFLLAETGLLDGRVATTNWQFARRFRQQFPRVRLRPEELITEQDNLFCSGAATAYLDFGLSLIDRYGSRELAGTCARALLVDPNRTSQAPYILERGLDGHGDTLIAKAQRIMAQQYHSLVAIDMIAAEVGLSSRHFKRRFKTATGTSPLTYLQNLRLDRAKERLATTADNIEEITRQIGYEDASTFRRLFRRRTSLSPREYRERFGQRGGAAKKTR